MNGVTFRSVVWVAVLGLAMVLVVIAATQGTRAVTPALAFDSYKIFPGDADHDQITDEAATNAGIKGKAKKALKKAVRAPDWTETKKSPSHPPNSLYKADHHCDRGPGVSDAEAFKATAKYIRAQTQQAIRQTKTGKKKAALAALGRALHALQDCKSHSNYVDLTPAEQAEFEAALNDGTKEPPKKLKITGFDPKASDPGEPPGDKFSHDDFSKDNSGKNKESKKKKRGKTKYELAQAAAIAESTALLLMVKTAVPTAQWDNLTITALARAEETDGFAWTPPTGTMGIAVVGTVRDEEVVMTSRGACDACWGGSIGGTVTLETEDGEELAVAVPDEDGYFTIDFGDIRSAAEVATFILTALDSDGNAQARTTVEYLPGTPPEVMGPPAPTHPEIPYLANYQLHELQGQNFGEGTEVVVTDQQGEATLQETLSSSTDRVMYFLDGTVGPTEVRVWNEFGRSEPFEIGVYEFGVTAGKTNLIRGETTSVTALYDGLPVGTRIVFTNMSENVTVTPNSEAEVAGNDVTFTVGESAGEVSMDVSARQAGGWVLNYRLEFPVSG